MRPFNHDQCLIEDQICIDPHLISRIYPPLFILHRHNSPHAFLTLFSLVGKVVERLLLSLSPSTPLLPLNKHFQTASS